MNIVEKYSVEIGMYYFTILLIIMLLGGYGRQAIEWVLFKLYELFVQWGK